MPGRDDERRTGVQQMDRRPRGRRRRAAGAHVFLDMLPELPQEAPAVAAVDRPRSPSPRKRMPMASSLPTVQDEPANLFEAVSLAQMQFCARGLLAWNRLCAAALAKS